MGDLITEVRSLIADEVSTCQQFTDVQIQNELDTRVNFIRYEGLAIAPSIVNLPSTNNQPSTIFADYFSKYMWWEQDVILQGQGTNNAAWVVITPTFSDYINGHWMFENTPFVNGTVPGQLPPVFCTGKVYDLYYAAGRLLMKWSAAITDLYDATVDGQVLNRSQIRRAKMAQAHEYLRMSKPKVVKQYRHDVFPPISTRRARLLDSDDVVKGA
jgi:hypothetical protein